MIGSVRRNFPGLSSVAGAVLASVTGCGSQPSQPHTRGLEAAERSVAKQSVQRTGQIETRPAALLNGSPIHWTDLHPALAELSGAVALEEVALDRLVTHELQRRGLTLTRDVILEERRILVQSVSQSAQTSPEEADRLIDEIRRARRLGEWRFEAMLRRNAGLRLCVRSQVDVTPEMIEQRYLTRFGPKVIARVIAVPTEAQAARLLADLSSRGEAVEARFIDLAIIHSTDESRARGGLLEPIALADPAYENIVRSTLGRLSPGALSGVVALEQGFAIFHLREAIPASEVVREEVRADIEIELRRRQERLLMDDLARELLREAAVAPLDRALLQSWQTTGSPP